MRKCIVLSATAWLSTFDAAAGSEACKDFKCMMPLVKRPESIQTGDNSDGIANPMVCCQNPPCQSFQCKDGRMKNPQSVFFTGEANDENCCMDKAKTCSDFKCKKPLVKMPNSADRPVIGSEEDAQVECCVSSKITCDTYKCPKGYLKKLNADDFELDEASRDTCCDEAPTTTTAATATKKKEKKESDKKDDKTLGETDDEKSDKKDKKHDDKKESSSKSWWQSLLGMNSDNNEISYEAGPSRVLLFLAGACAGMLTLLGIQGLRRSSGSSRMSSQTAREETEPLCQI